MATPKKHYSASYYNKSICGRKSPIGGLTTDIDMTSCKSCRRVFNRIEDEGYNMDKVVFPEVLAWRE